MEEFIQKLNQGQGLIGYLLDFSVNQVLLNFLVIFELLSGMDIWLGPVLFGLTLSMLNKNKL